MASEVENAERTRALFRAVCLIRRVEERLERLFADGEIPGFIHLSIGQEGVAAGVASALREGDTVASNHRGHGHALAQGVALKPFFAEVMGRDEGACRGRGGSMHVADISRGMLGANGIVGAGAPLALGSALAHQVKNSANIAVAYFGDGAVAEGVIHECLNLAALWRLPVLFVCENNGWSEFSRADAVLAVDLEKFAAAYGIAFTCVLGEDAETVASAAETCLADIRSGAGPALLECRTERHRGHFAGDSQSYRGAEDVERAEVVDPFAVMRTRLERLDPGEAARIDAEVAAEIEAAVAYARAASPSELEAAYNDVYARSALS